jgi:hypothetical protein
MGTMDWNCRIHFAMFSDSEVIFLNQNFPHLLTLASLMIHEDDPTMHDFHCSDDCIPDFKGKNRLSTQCLPYIQCPIVTEPSKDTIEEELGGEIGGGIS